jgi:molecular chaperone GrpE (heat shock protein)
MKHSVLTLGMVFCVSGAFAHNHHHLCREELLKVIEAQESVLEQKAKALEEKNKRIETQNKVIELQKQSIVCLEAEFEHIKHKLDKEHRHHSLKKAIHDLLISLGL